MFNKHERHQAIIKALASKRKGLTRAELIEQTSLTNGGGLSRILKELEESSFIRRYRNYGNKKRDSLYQLVDLYSLFYLNFIKDSSPDDDNFWINAIDSPVYRSWSGYSFEMLCLHHVQQMKAALGITGIQSSVYAWHSPEAQIDLLIDRKDQVINLCEMKFSIHPFVINKKIAENLANKIDAFRKDSKTKKAIFLTLITTYSISSNKYSYLPQNQITLDELFS